MVPNGWEARELQNLCHKISVGLAISVTPYMREKGVKLIRNQNIKRNVFSYKSIVYIDEQFAQFNESKKVKAGDVIAVRTGSNIGEACVVPKSFEGALTFTTLIARPNPDLLDSHYLSTHINSDRGVAEVNRLCAGGGKPNLNSGELKRYRLLTPPIFEQRKIAKILSTWDNAISTTERLIDNSKQQKKALMQQLLTGKKRLLDDSGKPFGGEWEEVKLSSLALSGKSNFTDGDWIESPYISESGCRLIQTGNIGVGVFKDKSQKYISESSFHELKCTEVKIGDLLICRLAEPAGRACVVPDLGEAKMLTSVDVTIMKVDDNKSSAEFLSHYFSLEHTLYTVSTLCGGSTRSRVSRTNLGKLKVHLPEVSEQKKITSVLTNADKEIELLEQQLTDLKHEKKALMQQLLTGKRRVKV